MVVGEFQVEGMHLLPQGLVHPIKTLRGTQPYHLLPATAAASTTWVS